MFSEGPVEADTGGTRTGECASGAICRESGVVFGFAERVPGTMFLSDKGRSGVTEIVGVELQAGGSPEAGVSTIPGCALSCAGSCDLDLFENNFQVLVSFDVVESGAPVLCALSLPGLHGLPKPRNRLPENRLDLSPMIVNSF